VQQIPYRFRAVDEELPAAKWQALVGDVWPSYRRWFLSQGNTSRPSFADCRAVLDRLPFQLAHNLTLLDASGTVLTAHVAPDRPPVSTSLPVATNQVVVEWPERAERARTLEREAHLTSLLDAA
jgi:hypothetical protein